MLALIISLVTQRKNDMKKNIATLLISTLGLALMIYTAMRGLDFIMQTLPADKQILAYFALAATEGGVLFFLGYYLFGAEGGWQRAISIIMLVIDFLGSIALFTADTLLRAGENGVIKTLGADEMLTVIFAMSGLIALNVAASIGLHLADPEAQKRSIAADVKDKVQAEAMRQLTEQSASMAAELAPSVALSMAEEIRAQFGVIAVKDWPKAEAEANKEIEPRKFQSTAEPVALSLEAKESGVFTAGMAGKE